MSSLVRPTLIITLFTLAGQGLGFLTQIVIAAHFGARADMDAFLAANTLPQYISTVLLASLSFVFIPVFVDYTAAGKREEAWHVASSVLTLTLVILGSMAVIGIVFAKPLLQWTTPGLSDESLALAATIARITWPMIVANGILSLLTGIYQAEGRFGWPAAVPVLGGLFNLVLVVLLVQSLGILGVAIAAMASMALQAVLLVPIAVGTQRYRPSFDWRHPGVIEILRLLTPLVLSSLLVRWTPIIDRFLASQLPSGTISHLGYAFKIVTLLSLLLATSIATVVFPRMAQNTAAQDSVGLRYTLSTGMRVMWLATAPCLALAIALALPLISAIFQRGAFTREDTAAVGPLFQVYALALVGMCLGNLTGRTFYAMKNTRIIGIAGVIEALAYAVYTPLLANRLGGLGVALGLVIYYDASMVWQVLYLRHKMGSRGGRQIVDSFLRTLVAAVGGGSAAWLAIQLIASPWLQLIGGGIAGSVVYIGSLVLLQSSEALSMLDFGLSWFRAKWHHARLPASF